MSPKFRDLRAVITGRSPTHFPSIGASASMFQCFDRTPLTPLVPLSAIPSDDYYGFLGILFLIIFRVIVQKVFSFGVNGPIFRFPDGFM